MNELTKTQKEWNDWVNSLYGDPKYKYHKNHEKHLPDDSTLFRDFLSLRSKETEPNE